jgi:hypothetical protein
MFINTNFAIQVVKDDTHTDFPYPNPFSDYENEQASLASAGYRYRMFDLSVHEDEDVRLILRTEVDAFVPGANAAEGQGLMTIKALNEFDAKAPGAGGAPDWRTKLDSQRGAVVATEMKNNSFKMARWAVQSILAGADVMKLGCVLLRGSSYHPHRLIFLPQMGVPRQPSGQQPAFNPEHNVRAPRRICRTAQCSTPERMGYRPDDRGSVPEAPGR